MFGKVEALVKKYPVFFTLGLLISSILGGKTLDASSREDQPHRKKKKKGLVFFVYYLLPHFTVLPYLWLKKVLLIVISNSTQVNLILKLNAYNRSYINYFLNL